MPTDLGDIPIWIVFSTRHGDAIVDLFKREVDAIRFVNAQQRPQDYTYRKAYAR